MLIDIVLVKKKVCVIGGGNVAYRKIKQFLQEGAYVYVITKEIRREEIKSLVSNIIIQPFSFPYFDDDTDLVYVAIDDRKESIHIVKEIQKKKILCGSATPCTSISYHSVAYEKKKQIHFAVSTNGCPGAISGYFQQMEPMLKDIAEKNEILRQLREKWLLQKIQSRDMKELLHELSLWNIHYLEKLRNTNKVIMICVYHGIAAVDKITKYLYAYEQRLEATANCVAMSIFFSEKICRKVNAYGYGMPDLKKLQDVLHKLCLSYRIQPMFLWDGYHYQMLKQACLSFLCAKPLLCEEVDIQRLTDILHKYQKTKTSIVIYHKQNHQRTLSLPENFYALDEIDRTIAQGDSIDVFPLFLLCGYHSEKDIQTTWMPKLYRCYTNVYLHMHLLHMEEIQQWFVQRISDI